MTEEERVLALTPFVRFSLTMAMYRKALLAGLPADDSQAAQAVRAFADAIETNLRKCGLDTMGLPALSLRFEDFRQTIREGLLEDGLQQILDGLPPSP